MAMRLGIDVGGTKIEIIALDEQGDTLLRERRPSPSHDYHLMVQTILELIRQAEAGLGRTGTVGLGIPGTLSPDHGRVKNANSVCLIGQDLRGDLELALGRPVRIANDADCFAWSEFSDGAGQGASSLFGVILGTGVGGGLVVNGGLVSGPNAIAGEWGHNPLPWPRDPAEQSSPCYCGKQGCIETWLSGPGFSRTYRERTHLSLNPSEIVQRASTGDTAAGACLEDYLDRLARSLATVINILDPEVVVLGGGMSNLDILYAEVPKRWGQYIFSDRVNTRLVRARHGDSSGVRGAAWLWPVQAPGHSSPYP